MASTGLRTLCMLCVDMKMDPGKPRSSRRRNLTLLGIVVHQGSNSAETAERSSPRKGAGVVVRMVTGDNALTAQAIAKEAGILVEGDDGLVLEGPVFR